MSKPFKYYCHCALDFLHSDTDITALTFARSNLIEVFLVHNAEIMRNWMAFLEGGAQLFNDIRLNPLKKLKPKVLTNDFLGTRDTLEGITNGLGKELFNFVLGRSLLP